ncbi:hypothetical protein KKG45_14385 [bacterium]|nr:hypothetical protein [bacterium]MBU1074426.1 hypothetical protein [bacterium]MBU1674340.1 hypothetical protein [bacterium]
MLFYPRIVLVLSGGLLIGCAKERPVARDFLIVPTDEAAPDESDGDGAAAPPVDDPLLEPCRPNPFGASTLLGFEVRIAGPVKLAVYDIGGRLLVVLTSGLRVAGRHEVTWNGRDARGHEAPAGVYFACLCAADRRESRRMVRVR